MIRAVILAAALALAGPALADPVKDSSFVDGSGGRVLQDSIIIAAPPAVVWKALSDQAAYRVWGAPNSWIDLRIGGSIEASFDPAGMPGDAGNLKQEIVAYLPERLLVFRNVAAPPLPGAALYPKLAIVLELRPAGDGKTEVVLSQVGYGGAEFDGLYGFFKSHNPDYLIELKTYAEKVKD